MKDKKLILVAVTFVTILVSGLLCKQPFFLMIPLFISLFVMAKNAEANRLAPLIGAINSVLYALAYVYIGIYVSAASALLFSFPIQLATFFYWKKRAYKKTVHFRCMKPKTRALLGLAFAALWAVMIVVFGRMDYDYAVLDSASFLLGFAVPVLTFLAYIEYTYLWIASAIFSIALNVQVVMADLRQLTYLIYSVYSFICIIMAFVNVHKFYKEQSEGAENK